LVIPEMEADAGGDDF
jgi:hypothetical protein